MFFAHCLFKKNPSECFRGKHVLSGHSNRKYSSDAGWSSDHYETMWGLFLECILYINKFIIDRHQRCLSHVITEFPGFRAKPSLQDSNDLNVSQTLCWKSKFTSIPEVSNRNLVIFFFQIHNLIKLKKPIALG